MLKGLFLNTSKANCSIYESGLMTYNCIRFSELFNIEYQEVDINRRKIELKYDFYIFNYHPQTMGWLNTKLVNRLPGYKATIVLEVAPGDPFVMVSKEDFDGYFCLDPTLIRKEDNVYSLPRPLDIV